MENEGDLTEKAQNLRRHLDLTAVLLTRSEEGMTLFSEGEPIYQPTRAQEVYDVSGAGDTVIAGMGLGLAAGCTMPEAMYLANTAVGLSWRNSVRRFARLQSWLKHWTGNKSFQTA